MKLSFTVALCLVGTTLAFPHFGGQKGGGCVMKRMKEACKDDAENYCEDELDSGDDTSVYSCMSLKKYEETSYLDAKCLEIVQSNSKLDARFTCATEIKNTCPDVGSLYESDEDLRCLHDMYTSGFSETCSSAFELAWKDNKEKKGMAGDETPMDTDVSDILIQKNLFSPEYATGYDYEYIFDYDDEYALFHVAVAAVIFCIVSLLFLLTCACCIKHKRRRCRHNQQMQNNYRISASAPPAFPIAMPYQSNTTPYQPLASQPSAVQLPMATVAVPSTNFQPQQLSPSGYPGLR